MDKYTTTRAPHRSDVAQDLYAYRTSPRVRGSDTSRIASGDARNARHAARKPLWAAAAILVASMELLGACADLQRSPHDDSQQAQNASRDEDDGTSMGIAQCQGLLKRLDTQIEATEDPQLRRRLEEKRRGKLALLRQWAKRPEIRAGLAQFCED